MREIRLYGSEGGGAKAPPTPIGDGRDCPHTAADIWPCNHEDAPPWRVSTEVLGLSVGDWIPECLYVIAGVEEAMATLMCEEREDLADGGCLARASVRVDRERFELVGDHGVAKLALEQGINGDGDKEAKSRLLAAFRG